MTWLTEIASYGSIWLTLHLFALVLGLGGATYGDILLIRFMKDLKISHKEADVIRTLSRVVLMGIILATVSGFFLFLPKQEALMVSAKFQAKLGVFLILVINGFLLHHYILPRLVKFSFHQDHYLWRKIITLRHAGFVMGAISIVSWYSVFLLGSFDPDWTLESFALVYGGVLFVAIVTALLIERRVRLSMPT